MLQYCHCYSRVYDYVSQVGKQAKWEVIPMTNGVENTLNFIKFVHPSRNWRYRSNMLTSVLSGPIYIFQKKIYARTIIILR